MKDKKKIKGTLRQIKAIKNLVQNGGNVSKAMRDAGMSPVTAKNPKKLTESKAFKELAEEMLPDNLLLKVHKEGLEATATQSLIVGYKPGAKKGMKSVPIVEVRNDPDFSVRHRYLDTAYKIRGKLKQNTNVIVPMQVNVAADRTKYS